MKDNFDVILNALKSAGFSTALEQISGKVLDFKITPYSLNTKLSFRFEGVNDFTEFLNASGNADVNLEQVNNALIELNMDPNSFFYVNFFEKGQQEDL